MNKTRAVKITKISLSMVGAFALTISTVHASAANQVSPPTNGFSIQNAGPSIDTGSSLPLNSDSIFVGSPTFSLPAAADPGTGTVVPVQRNIRRVVLSRPVPDSGSTLICLALSLFGLFLMGRKLVKT